MNYRPVWWALLALLWCTACTSPNDIDTPRKTTYGDPPPLAITSADLTITLDVSTPGIAYTCLWTEQELDTAGGLALRLRGTCTLPAQVSPQTMPLTQLIIRFDRLKLDADSVRITGDTPGTEGTAIVCVSPVSGGSQNFFPDNGPVQFILRNIVYDRAERTVTASLVVEAPLDGRPFGVMGTLRIRHQ